MGICAQELIIDLRQPDPADMFRAYCPCIFEGSSIAPDVGPLSPDPAASSAVEGCPPHRRAECKADPAGSIFSSADLFFGTGQFKDFERLVSDGARTATLSFLDRSGRTPGIFP
jgi:hypothetical protein